MVARLSQLSRQFQQSNNRVVSPLNFESIMKKNILGYTAPELNIFEVVAERGYNVSEPIIGGGTSTTLPGFGSESDELIY